MMSLIDGKLGDQLLALFFVCVCMCVSRYYGTGTNRSNQNEADDGQDGQDD